MEFFRAQFNFSGGLCDFLKKGESTGFVYKFFGTPSVKDAIEAIGIPHPEVDGICANGTPVDFSYKLRNGDNIFVTDKFIENSKELREKLSTIKFILDVHLGKLARKLRLLGLDTFYLNSLGDREIIEIALRENRIILTRDQGLLKVGKVIHGYWVRATCPKAQLKEICRRFKAVGKAFSRCLECNGKLEPAQKKEIIDKLPPKVAIFFDEFYICGGCKRVFWKGSHFQAMSLDLLKMNLPSND